MPGRTYVNNFVPFDSETLRLVSVDHVIDRYQVLWLFPNASVRSSRYLMFREEAMKQGHIIVADTFWRYIKTFLNKKISKLTIIIPIKFFQAIRPAYASKII